MSLGTILIIILLVYLIFGSQGYVPLGGVPGGSVLVTVLLIILLLRLMGVI